MFDDPRVAHGEQNEAFDDNTHNTLTQKKGGGQFLAVDEIIYTCMDSTIL